MKVCIAGKNKIAIDTVKLLINYDVSRDNILVVFNQNEDGVNNWQPSFKFFCQKEGLKAVKLSECYDIEGLIFLSAEFDKIIRPSKFKTAQLFNVHFSFLPAYKGMYTAVMPLLNGESSSGVTLHKIDKGIDTGDIIDQIAFDVPESLNARRLYDLFLEQGKQLMEKNLPSILNNTFRAYPQAKINSSYYSKKAIDFSNIILDLNSTAWEIHNQIRAFAFRPYQLPYIHNHKVTHSCILDSKSKKAPGTIVEDHENYLILSSIDYDVMVYKDCLDDILFLAETGQTKKIEKLQKLGLNIFEKNDKGWDALIVAAYYEQLEMCKWLLSQGANVNTTNYNGTSPLMYAMSAASQSGNMQVMSCLIENGANIHHKDFAEKSLIEYAQESGADFIVDFLKYYLG